ncbi:Fhl1 transcription factor [Candida orthopsilosis Co 90-125]|uniref:Fhl1 transcription factor n=1 Tax=Candida orthopsilosis (strain 90-125) TaxID=1136231 RepID=H8WZS6_CANO9|nr:Fhl1 transcription factor [Candida orthopsilosis Co 90-125]CCG22271.1 Fhl1 transcription factor [Candida orthopsilosis Co 90-125]
MSGIQDLKSSNIAPSENQLQLTHISSSDQPLPNQNHIESQKSPRPEVDAGLILDEELNMLLTTSQPQQDKLEGHSKSEPQDLNMDIKESYIGSSKTVSGSQTPNLKPLTSPKSGEIGPLKQDLIQDNSANKSRHTTEKLKRVITHQEQDAEESVSNSRVSAYARLDFENNVFYVQTLQVVLGRKSNDEFIQQDVDVHLSERKAISRRHAKIFYNFGTQRFEISVLGKNGAFVDETFVEKGVTIPLIDGVKIQIGDISFRFVLPAPPNETLDQQNGPKQFNPSDAINLKSNLFSKPPMAKDSLKKSLDSDSHHDNKLSLRKKSMSRRDSLLRIRKLSNARRKSAAANDELNELLKDLGVTSIENINEEESDLLDAQIQSLLNEDSELGLGDGMISLARMNESAIADDDDEFDLVKGIEQDAKMEKEILEIDASINQLNREIAELASQGGNESLIIEKDELRKSLEETKKQKKDHISQRRSSFVKNAGPLRSTPLMGKPASIQPSSSSTLYNRFGTLDKSLPFLTNSAMPQAILPKLEAPVFLITSEPGAIRTRPPPRAIAVEDHLHRASYYYPKTLEQQSQFPKPKGKKIIPRKTPKRVYSIEEIPEQYRSKPNLTFTSMASNVLSTGAASNGLTINETIEAIKEVYPYFKYCQEGWQASVAHCIKNTKIFKRVVKRGYEWLYTMDEPYKSERDSVKSKHKEYMDELMKAEILRQQEIRQNQRIGQYELNNKLYTNRNTQPPVSRPVPPVQYDHGVQSNSGQVKAFPQSPVATPQPSASINDAKTQKSLDYLRAELFKLYKSRNVSYDKVAATQLITKALATTIAQVNNIGAKAGCGDNALNFLVEKAPQQVSKILDIALTKSIKEHEGGLASARSTPSRSSPVPAPSSSGQQTYHTAPGNQSQSINHPITGARPQSSPIFESNNLLRHSSPESSSGQNANTPSHTTPLQNTNSPPKAVAGPKTETSPSPRRPVKSTPDPPLSRPSFGKPPNLGRPGSYARPQAYGKPPGVGNSLSRPPTFLSNKPSFHSGVKRETDADNYDSGQPTKAAKTQ